LCPYLLEGRYIRLGPVAGGYTISVKDIMVLTLRIEWAWSLAM
jgi:hypothetical protein